MPYLGNPAVDRFTSTKAASVYSGDGSTVAFTLEHSVGADEDILVSVDGVIQEPSVAYAVSSGTTLTFTAAPSSNSGNNIFVYYLFRTIGTVTHPPTSALSATSGTFTDDIIIGDGKTIGSASDVDAMAISSGGVVTFSQNPIFSLPFINLTKSGDQAISAGTETQITGFNTYASSQLALSSNTIPITSATAGTYFMCWQISTYSASNNIGDVRAAIYVDTTRTLGAYNLIVQGSTSADPFDLRHYTVQTSGCITVTNGQVIKLYAFINGTSPNVFAGDSSSPLNTNFTMYRIGV